MAELNRPIQPAQSSSAPPAGTEKSSGMSLSMHDGVEVWCDCCSCEAEPYWVAAFDEECGSAEN
jgi:hypothetical protein